MNHILHSSHVFAQDPHNTPRQESEKGSKNELYHHLKMMSDKQILLNG